MTNIDMDIQEPTSDNPSPSKGLLKATMPDIDKRLQEILTDIVKSIFGDQPEATDKEIIDFYVAAIHLAFKDAGYISKDEIDTWQADFKKRWNAMTGPEWLERFINELPQGYLVDPPILTAARRACGDISDKA